MYQGHLPVKFPGGDPDQSLSWLLFKILIKSLFKYGQNGGTNFSAEFQD